MTLLSRLIAYLLLPLLLFVGGYLLLYWLGSGLVEELPLQAIAIGLAALLAALPPVAFRIIIRSQIREGFALLRDGRILLPEEITLGTVLGNRISAWKLFHQHLDTEICLQDEGRLIFVRLGLHFSLPRNEHGKRFVKNYQHSLSLFEAWVQRTIYLASAMDRDLAHTLASNTLMNEEDEGVLRSKILSALEMQHLQSVELPVDTSGLHIARQVRVERKSTITPLDTTTNALPDDADLQLDSELLAQLGIDTPS